MDRNGWVVGISLKYIVAVAIAIAVIDAAVSC